MVEDNGMSFAALGELIAQLDDVGMSDSVRRLLRRSLIVQLGSFGGLLTELGEADRPDGVSMGWLTLIGNVSAVLATAAVEDGGFRLRAGRYVGSFFDDPPGFTG